MNKLFTNLKKYNKQHIRRALLSITFIFFTVAAGYSNSKAVFDPVKDEELSEPARIISSINVINDQLSIFSERQIKVLKGLLRHFFARRLKF